MVRGIVVLAVGLLACAIPGQTTTEWKSVIEKAHKHRRMMLRRAAARKVAAAGDAAIVAVRAFEKENGRQTISLDFVTAYGRVASSGEATLALLEEWARDHDFYWRSQALEALANRRLKRFEKLFAARLTDPAYLTRIQAARGLFRLGLRGDRVLGLLRDTDPRVRLRVAICLTREKDDLGLPTLVESMRQDAKFLDYAWGPLGANTAFKTLQKVAGTEFGYAVGESPEKNHEAIAQFEKFAHERLGSKWVDPVRAFHDGAKYRGGTAIRSCRNGDLFVRFSDDRRIVFGLEARETVRLPAAAWTKLWNNAPGEGKGVRGKVICDYLRVMCKNPTVDEKFPPGAMSKKSSDWLLALSVALEKNGGQDLARQIEARLPQFSVRRTP
jgi:hypothetical protein